MGFKFGIGSIITIIMMITTVPTRSSNTTTPSSTHSTAKNDDYNVFTTILNSKKYDELFFHSKILFI